MDPLLSGADDLSQGFDTVHLSATLVWQESLAESVFLVILDLKAGRANDPELWPVS